MARVGEEVEPRASLAARLQEAEERFRNVHEGTGYSEVQQDELNQLKLKMHEAFRCEPLTPKISACSAYRLCCRRVNINGELHVCLGPNVWKCRKRDRTSNWCDLTGHL
jgi:hypothetical protein